jgi:small-conductance mechanosensitive channel
MKVLIALIIAALVFLLLKVIKLGIKQLQNIYSGLRIVDNIIVATEFLLWLAYSFWVIYYLFGAKFYYRYLIYALILIIIVFVSWFLLRDIFAGIIFRTKHNFRNGSFIKAEGYSGQIKSQRLTCLEIITPEKQLMRIPYIKLVNGVITEAASRGPVEEFIIHVKIDISVDKKDAESLIRKVLLNSPWSPVNEDPSIRFLKEDESGYFYDIKLLSKNLMNVKNIEMSLEQIDTIQVI